MRRQLCHNLAFSRSSFLLSPNPFMLMFVAPIVRTDYPKESSSERQIKTFPLVGILWYLGGLYMLYSLTRLSCGELGRLDLNGKDGL